MIADNPDHCANKRRCFLHLKRALYRREQTKITYFTFKTIIPEWIFIQHIISPYVLGGGTFKKNKNKSNSSV